jgi:parallel beta-helix repeat protein
MLRKTVSAIMLVSVLVSTLMLAVNIQRVEAGGTVGVKAGDWIKITYTITGWPVGQPYPEWLKVEFLTVEGTNATVHVTMRMSDGTEQSDTMTVDVAVGGGTFQGLSGFVILANCTTGDSIYITGYGNLAIAGESTRIYAGASRTVVYANFSFQENQLTYYWDKHTGVMVESSAIYPQLNVTATAKATETNMWQSETIYTETIYIRTDGSIEPAEAPIFTVDSVTYTFTDNIVADIPEDSSAIVIERDNIVLDGADYMLQGTEAYKAEGITLTGRTNVTVKNTQIENFDYGIRLESSSNNSISGNNIANNRYGITLHHSSNNSLRDNVMGGNFYNFGVYGSLLSHFVNDVDASNTVDGKPVYYLVGVRDVVVPLEAGYVALINSTNIKVENLTLTKNLSGILLAYTSNSTISGNNIANNWDGIYLSSSSSNTISGNNITDNNDDGIYLYESSDNSISGNNVTANNDDGIYLYESSDNSISGNNVTANNDDGIDLGYSSNNSISGNNVTDNEYDGFYLHHYSSSNTISGNNIANNWANGITLSWSSDNNSIVGNNIANNWDGIALDFSSNNLIYHNNFMDNTQQVYFTVSGYANFWDDGYPSGGNYWSDYEYRYPNAEELDGSGMWNMSYVIDENNQDNYPLMSIWWNLCDINKDGEVNIQDLFIVAKAWQAKPGDEHWDSRADLDGNDLINIIDLYEVAKDYGETV